MSESRISIKDLFKRSAGIQAMSAMECRRQAEWRAWSQQLQRNAAAKARAESAEYAVDTPDYARDTPWSIFDRLLLTEPESVRVQTLAKFERMSQTFRGVNQRTAKMSTSRENQNKLLSGDTESVKQSWPSDKVREEVFRNLGLLSHDEQLHDHSTSTGTRQVISIQNGTRKRL